MTPEERARALICDVIMTERERMIALVTEHLRCNRHCVVGSNRDCIASLPAELGVPIDTPPNSPVSPERKP